MSGIACICTGVGEVSPASLRVWRTRGLSRYSDWSSSNVLTGSGTSQPCTLMREDFSFPSPGRFWIFRSNEEVQVMPLRSVSLRGPSAASVGQKTANSTPSFRNNSKASITAAAWSVCVAPSLVNIRVTQQHLFPLRSEHERPLLVAFNTPSVKRVITARSQSHAGAEPSNEALTERQGRVSEGVSQSVAGVPPDLHGGLRLDGFNQSEDRVLQRALERRAGQLTLTQEMKKISKRSYRVGLHLGGDDGREPGRLGADVWRAIVEGGEDRVRRIRHEHHILEKRQSERILGGQTHGSDTRGRRGHGCPYLSQTGEQDVDAQSPDGRRLHQVRPSSTVMHIIWVLSLKRKSQTSHLRILSVGGVGTIREELTGSCAKACGRMEDSVSQALVCSVGCCSLCSAAFRGPLSTSDQNRTTYIMHN
ncbi:hypothetical protein EYF80_026314 [Liparis tanakae]|uniref:Uncharacterized protein n=1 Tax=Liparis tanakae TaxID=230148 RepID=A0A4Z2HEW8_9TELE|nr:hypothetical protein EYF80_026314 [Liparis tanakae]